MKPAVAVMILSKRIEEGKLLLLHVTNKATGFTNPVYLTDFDGGLAHGWHITVLTNDDENTIELIEAWMDVEEWVAFSVEKVCTLDEAKLRVETLNKIRNAQQNHPLGQVFERMGGGPQPFRGTKQ